HACEQTDTTAPNTTDQGLRSHHPETRFLWVRVLFFGLYHQAMSPVARTSSVTRRLPRVADCRDTLRNGGEYDTRRLRRLCSSAQHRLPRTAAPATPGAPRTR